MESDLIEFFIKEWNTFHSNFGQCPVNTYDLHFCQLCNFFSRGGGCASAKHLLGVQKYFCGAYSPLHRVHAPENSFLVSIVTFSFEP